MLKSFEGFGLRLGFPVDARLASGNVFRYLYLIESFVSLTKLRILSACFQINGWILLNDKCSCAFGVIV